MTELTNSVSSRWTRVSMKFLPFADIDSKELPLSRLMRLSLFQVTVGMALVLVTGTLNRVLIVELGVAAWFVALVVALPVVFAPLRALIGYRSDTYQSAFGWRRVPFIWTGTLLQWGGLAIMPFAMLVVSGDAAGPIIIGQLGAGLAFLLVGAGLHTTQTAGLALASDLAKPELRPRVVALLFVMLLLGMVISSLTFGWLLADYTPRRLIQVIQGSALVTMVFNVIALWKQEPRDPVRAEVAKKTTFKVAWQSLRSEGHTVRLLVAVAIGTAGFTMQDILLEPFGGQILNLSVGATTGLTALWAGGMLIAFALAARRLGAGVSPNRLAGYGVLVGIIAFALVTASSALQVLFVFCFGVGLIGIGGGLFAVGTMTAAMQLANSTNSGLALGAWGAVQATATGVAIALGGALRDMISAWAMDGAFGTTLQNEATGYGAVYLLEILLLFATLAAIGPLASFTRARRDSEKPALGLAQIPS